MHDAGTSREKQLAQFHEILNGLRTTQEILNRLVPRGDRRPLEKYQSSTSNLTIYVFMCL
jgi:hypothetical protein